MSLSIFQSLSRYNRDFKNTWARFLTWGIILLLGLYPAQAKPEESSRTRVPIPDPAVFLDSDTTSIAVLIARPNDSGVVSLLNAAWQEIEHSSLVSGSGVVSTIISLLKSSEGDNPLLSFLPIQVVRADAISPSGQPHPTIAVSIAGWAGLQSLFYSAVITDRNGHPYPTRDIDADTVVLRRGWQDPGKAAITSRVNGTFLNMPTLKKARTIIRRLNDNLTDLPPTELGRIYATLNHKADTYGVLLNTQNNLINFLYWFNKPDMKRIVKKLGKERVQDVLNKVKMLSWWGDIVSDDRIEFHGTFRTDSPASAHNLKKALQEAISVLDSYGRVGAVELTAKGNLVDIYFAMTGYRKALLYYLRNKLPDK